MGRTAKRYPSRRIRANIRTTYVEALEIILAHANYFDPTKPAHGDKSKVIENLVEEWLKRKLTKEAFTKLLLARTPEEVQLLGLTRSLTKDE